MFKAQGAAKIFLFSKRKLYQVLSTKFRKVFVKNSRTVPETPYLTVKLHLDMHIDEIKQLQLNMAKDNQRYVIPLPKFG